MQNSIHNTLFNGCQYEKYLQMIIFFATRSQNMQIFILQGVSIFQHPVVNMRKMPIFDTHKKASIHWKAIPFLASKMIIYKGSITFAS